MKMESTPIMDMLGAHNNQEFLDNFEEAIQNRDATLNIEIRMFFNDDKENYYLKGRSLNTVFLKNYYEDRYKLILGRFLSLLSSIRNEIKIKEPEIGDFKKVITLERGGKLIAEQSWIEKMAAEKKEMDEREKKFFLEFLDDLKEELREEI